MPRRWPFLKAGGQGLEPRPIFGLEGEQDSDGIAPAPGTASVVGRSPVVDHRQGRGADGAMTGLSLGIAHRSVAEGLAGHGSNPKRYVTERRTAITGVPDRAAACQGSGAVFEAPALVAGLDDFAVMGQPRGSCIFRPWR